MFPLGVLGVTVGGVALLVLLGGSLYARVLHPAWQKERRLIRACEVAFGEAGEGAEGRYRLERLHLRRDGPSGADLLCFFPGVPAPPLYFTYNVEANGEAPDESDMTRGQIRLLRRYLHGPRTLPHYERDVLRPAWNVSASPREGRLEEG